MKKFMNRPEDVVEKMMQGLAVVHPSSARVLGHKVMVRADAEQAHVQQFFDGAYAGQRIARSCRNADFAGTTG